MSCIGRAAFLPPGLDSGSRERGPKFTRPLCRGGHPSEEAAQDAVGAARSGGSAMFLFGVLWLALLAAELTIAYQFLKTQIRRH